MTHTVMEVDGRRVRLHEQRDGIWVIDENDVLLGYVYYEPIDGEYYYRLIGERLMTHTGWAVEDAVRGILGLVDSSSDVTSDGLGVVLDFPRPEES